MVSKWFWSLTAPRSEEKSLKIEDQTCLWIFLNQLYMIWKARIWRLSWNLWPEKKDIVGWSGRSKFSSKKWGKINEIHRKSIKIGAKNGNRVYLNSSRLIAQWFGNITWQTVARETMKLYKKTWSNPISAEGVLGKWLRSLKRIWKLLEKIVLVRAQDLR